MDDLPTNQPDDDFDPEQMLREVKPWQELLTANHFVPDQVGSGETHYGASKGDGKREYVVWVAPKVAGNDIERPLVFEFFVYHALASARERENDSAHFYCSAVQFPRVLKHIVTELQRSATPETVRAFRWYVAENDRFSSAIAREFARPISEESKHRRVKLVLGEAELPRRRPPHVPDDPSGKDIDGMIHGENPIIQQKCAPKGARVRIKGKEDSRLYGLLGTVECAGHSSAWIKVDAPPGHEDDRDYFESFRLNDDEFEFVYGESVNPDEDEADAERFARETFEITPVLERAGYRRQGSDPHFACWLKRIEFDRGYLSLKVWPNFPHEGLVSVDTDFVRNDEWQTVQTVIGTYMDGLELVRKVEQVVGSVETLPELLSMFAAIKLPGGCVMSKESARQWFGEAKEDGEEEVPPEHYINSVGDEPIKNRGPESTPAVSRDDALNMAIKDYRKALGKFFTVDCVTGYNNADNSEDVEGPFVVQVTHTNAADIDHWNDMFLDPYWNVEVVSGNEKSMQEIAQKGLRSMWTFGPSYRLLSDNEGIAEAEADEFDPERYIDTLVDHKALLTSHGFEEKNRTGAFTHYVKNYAMPRAYRLGGMVVTLMRVDIQTEELANRVAVLKGVVIGFFDEHNVGMNACDFSLYPVEAKVDDGDTMTVDIDMLMLPLRRFLDGIDNAVAEIPWPAEEPMLSALYVVKSTVGKFVRRINSIPHPRVQESAI